MPELRTTTGQRVTISYDPRNNALTFTEIDWFADPLRSTGIPEKSRTVSALHPRNVISLSTRRKVSRAA
jgi:hypothetical protein